ncbi:MAG: hypothetical protein JW982_00500 [Spirochaetes bacterium]|nr:hypothetical protein [Spirochaetota bacterium]
MIKYIFSSLVAVFICFSITASENTIVVAGFEYDSPRTSVIAAQMEIHFNSVMDNFTTLNYVNPADFRNFAVKKNISLKKDIIALADSLDITSVIFVRLKDRITEIEFIIEAYGTDIPYNNSRICILDKTIDTSRPFPDDRYNLMSEDITIQFLIRFLDNYTFPDFSGNSGSNPIYEMKEIDGFKTYAPAGGFEKGKTFHFSDLKKESVSLENYFYSKKQEITVQPAELETTLFLFTLTPVFSAVSLFATPVNYYKNGKYSETGLWALSVAPYYYLMAQGFLNNPVQIKKDKSEPSVSRYGNANYIFAWYQLLGGGTAFFIDSVASEMLYDSSNYYNRVSYIDNSEYAIFLSLICGGAGHFYKGSRKWGYFFYHTDTILLYSTIYFLSSKETFSPDKNRYVSEKPDYSTAAVTGTLLLAVKTFEIFNLMHTSSDLSLGRESQNLISFQFYPDYSGGFNLSLTRKF